MGRMMLRPNKSLIEGKIKRIARAADGVGADVVIDVHACKAADDMEDFVGAAPGAEVTLFTSEPEALESGKTYRLKARVLGGPNGERTVIESARLHNPSRKKGAP
jgi:hypothetical protein